MRSKLRIINNLLVTGGAGFIGSNFIRYVFEKTDFSGNIVNFDKLTYAGNLDNLYDLEKRYGDRYNFKRGDIRDYNFVRQIMLENNIDTVVHMAAESHVDRSISGPKDFIQTNINGTFNLLEVCRESWRGNYKDVWFHHVSTDEVYGSLGDTGFFFENTRYDPRSPYSASKAASDHLVRAYYHTYGLPVTISNCSNNYGPYQFPEKLIPLMICNIKDNKALPVYGDGKNIRDWLYVEDHCSAIWNIINKGKVGETYNIGGENEWENIKLINVLCEKISKYKGKDREYYKNLTTYVPDRAGHDRRYAIDCNKIKNTLGWSQSVSFNEGLDKTIEWYMNNDVWINRVQSGDYRAWIEKNYNNR